MFYKYSSPCLASNPGQTIVVWKRKAVDAAKLIPALVS